jgi:hypothetical protein
MLNVQINLLDINFFVTNPASQSQTLPHFKGSYLLL